MDTTADATALPGDIRLMNTVAAVIGAGLLAAGLWAAVGWTARLPMFQIREIEVGGEVERSSVATIRANAAPRLQGNFFSIDLDAARAAFESVPWVREAVVRRVWPDTLAVELREHRAAAYWGDEQLVNTEGQVFQANLGDVEEENLPTLRGPKGSSAAMLSMLHRLTPLLQPVSLRIVTLELSGRGSWSAALDGGATLELGRGSEDELAERTARFARTLPQVAAEYPRALLYADLRHTGAYALRLEGVQTTTAPPPAPGRGRTPTRPR